MIVSAGSMRSGGSSFARSSGFRPVTPISASPVRIFAIPVGSMTLTTGFFVMPRPEVSDVGAGAVPS